MAESPCSPPMTCITAAPTPCCNNVNRPCAPPGVIILNASFAASPNPCRFPKRSDQPTCQIHNRRDCSVNRNRRVESGTGAPTVGSGGGSVAFASGLSGVESGTGRAYGRVRWRFRCFRVGPQSGSHGHVSSPRSSNRACGFPAHGSRTRSCLRPREADRSRSKVSEPVFLP